jgi:hypothetical protein
LTLISQGMSRDQKLNVRARDDLVSQCKIIPYALYTVDLLHLDLQGLVLLLHGRDCRLSSPDNYRIQFGQINQI